MAEQTRNDYCDRAAKAYRIERGWPTKPEWIEKYRDGMMAYEIGYEVEEAFEAGFKKGADWLARTLNGNPLPEGSDVG